MSLDWNLVSIGIAGWLLVSNRSIAASASETKYALLQAVPRVPLALLPIDPLSKVT